LVLADIPRPPVRRVVVADNNSTDSTAAVAEEGGAIVVPAPMPGYGAACLAGLDFVRQNDPPEIIVFLDGVGPRFPTRAVKEIVPFVDKTFRTQPDREARLAVGFGFNAASAMMVAAGNPDVFGKLSAQSPLLFAAAKEALIPMFAKVEQPLEVYLDWGRFDMYNPHENWDVRSTAAAVAKTIAKNPNVTVVGGQVNDSTDWSSWRNRYDKILALLK
jgi:glycosyltransferase involved in cell wall biosynthesis